MASQTLDGDSVWTSLEVVPPNTASSFLTPPVAPVVALSGRAERCFSTPWFADPPP